MIPGFYALGAGLLLAMARGWLWRGERLRAPGERQPAYQFLLGLLGLSLSMVELQRLATCGDAFASRIEPIFIAKPGYGALRAAHLRPITARSAREAKLRRRSAFRAENPRRILRVE